MEAAAPLRLFRGDPVFSVLLGRWGLGERGVACLTFALGFGVLATWCLVGLAVDPAARGRRGLFEYYSGTLGDALLLPVLSLAAVRYAWRVQGGLVIALSGAGRHARRLLAAVERAYNAPPGLSFVLSVAVMAVALEHVDELYGVDRNWTVPEWGRLSTAAAYHQAFFACQAYVVAFLVLRHAVTIRLLLRLARLRTSRTELVSLAQRSLWAFGWALLGWGAFVSLRLTDFLHVTPTISARALAALPAPVATLAAYYVALVVAGIAPALAVSRRYALGWSRSSILLNGACLVAPIAGPAVRILAAQLLAV
jgi:hypothetical protein